MASLYDELKERVRLAARVLALPLGWEGEPFVPPHASTLAGQVARYFPRGDDIRFDSGTATITTPRKSAPSCDGKRTEAVVNVGFYAFQA